MTVYSLPLTSCCTAICENTTYIEVAQRAPPYVWFLKGNTVRCSFSSHLARIALFYFSSSFLFCFFFCFVLRLPGKGCMFFNVNSGRLWSIAKAIHEAIFYIFIFHQCTRFCRFHNKYHPVLRSWQSSSSTPAYAAIWPSQSISVKSPSAYAGLLSLVKPTKVFI